MTLTRLLPGPTEVFALKNQWRETLAALYETPQELWLRINLIASVNGNAAGADGTSHGLSSSTDRRILGAIRRLSDVVVVGASSVRKEGYFFPKPAPLAIVTGSGDLIGHQIPSDIDETRLIVLCPPEARDTLAHSLRDTRVTVITLPGPRMHPAAIVKALRARGHNRIVCEGGPSLAAQFLDAGVVDEVCLSTSPLLNNTNVPVFQGLSHSQRLKLTQLLVDQESVLYARWQVQDGSAARPTSA